MGMIDEQQGDESQFPPLSNLKRKVELRLREPEESEALELKCWMDLRENNRAKNTVAREVAALANSGGEWLVFGIDDKTLDIDPKTPEDIAGFDRDLINGFIEPRVDPAVHCRVVHAKHQDSGRHVLAVSVPGHSGVPHMMRKGGDTEDGEHFEPHEVLIRKPGPKSEKPHTAQEWRRLLTNCVVKLQSELMPAIELRAADPEDHDTAKATDRRDVIALRDSLFASLIRPIEQSWSYIQASPFAKGRVSLSFMRVREGKTFAPDDLTAALREIPQSKLILNPWCADFRGADKPRVSELGDAVRCYIDFESSTGTSRLEFWYADEHLSLCYITPFAEDCGSYDLEPGTALRLDHNAVLIQESLFVLQGLLDRVDADSREYVANVHWHGLKDRVLFKPTWSSEYEQRGQAHVESASTFAKFNANELRSEHVGVIRDLLTPLAVEFDDFTLSSDYVRQQLLRLSRIRDWELI